MLFIFISRNIYIYIYISAYIVIYVKALESQEELRPFPWPRSGSRCMSEPLTSPGSNRAAACFSAMSGALPTSSDRNLVKPEPVSGPLDSLECIDYILPPTGVPAGKVLEHAKHVVHGLLEKHAPMVFKLGYTHDPVWRWTNSIYGYSFDCYKYTNMVILYESSEAAGPAMLEASLIDFFRSILA